MKRFKAVITILSAILILFLNSCEKKIVPILETSSVSNITGISATSGGTITDEGSGTVVERGLCWSKGITPTIKDDHTLEGGGAGSFVSNMNNLEPATNYYVRAYAKNEAGVGYGMAMAFETMGSTPEAVTQPATDLTTTSAVLNASVNPNYISSTVTFEYGLSTSYGNVVAAIQNPVTGNTPVNVSASLSNLTIATEYHFRVKATNSLGTTYGNDKPFRIPPPPPSNGLVAFYPFNGNANDQTSNGNHGVVHGATLTANRFGTLNSAYYFDGINDDITGTTSNWPFYKSPRTISVWGKLGSLPQWTNALLLTYGVAQLHSSNAIYFQLVSGQEKVFYTAYQDEVSTNYDYKINDWYHFVGTFDGSVATLYVNGILVASENKPSWNNMPANFHIGSLDNWTSWFNGAIDDIRIYNRVLSQDEILSLYYEIP